MGTVELERGLLLRPNEEKFYTMDVGDPQIANEDYYFRASF
jgi:hypothetical protein